MQLERCQIIEYSGLSHCTFIDLSTYRQFFITLLYLGSNTNQMSTPFRYHLCLLVWGQWGPVLSFFGVFIAEAVEGVGDKGLGLIPRVLQQKAKLPVLGPLCSIARLSRFLDY
jgi:hypothetical protein